MSVALSLNELMDYTDWERQRWHAWFLEKGDEVLKTSTGPHGDGRFPTVGEVVRHMFSAETRYVDRLSDRPLTDTGSIPADNIEALFAFGRQSRKGLRNLIETFPAAGWDTLNEYKFMNNLLRATPRKIIAHVVLHEIRHWAQIATLLRFHGLTTEFHDFLFSPVLGGEMRRETAS
jgi:uncharacterized damage-inducible protein DinB